MALRVPPNTFHVIFIFFMFWLVHLFWYYCAVWVCVGLWKTFIFCWLHVIVFLFCFGVFGKWGEERRNIVIYSVHKKHSSIGERKNVFFWFLCDRPFQNALEITILKFHLLQTCCYSVIPVQGTELSPISLPKKHHQEMERWNMRGVLDWPWPCNVWMEYTWDFRQDKSSEKT